MKIAMLSPITWRTPPRNYGPWEQVVSVLTEALVKKGIEVTLFASGDSRTEAELRWVRERPLGEEPGDGKVWECLHISALMESAHQFDIVHNQYDFLPLTYSRLIRPPMISTIHGFSSENILPVYQKYNGHVHYVSISNSDRHHTLDYLDTVYNGIDESKFAFGGGKGGYLLFFGRIHPHKGTYESIQLARETGHRLIICGLIHDQEYFDKKVAPFIDNEQIVYKGNVGPEERELLLGDAMALLHPISFEEPFGLSVAEAMICGTPVIAFNRGSMKELIKHRETGFLVTTLAEAATAIRNIDRISREACREHALANFSGTRMAEHYIELYHRIYRG